MTLNRRRRFRFCDSSVGVVRDHVTRRCAAASAAAGLRQRPRVARSPPSRETHWTHSSAAHARKHETRDSIVIIDDDANITDSSLPELLAWREQVLMTCSSLMLVLQHFGRGARAGAPMPQLMSVAVQQASKVPQHHVVAVVPDSVALDRLAARQGQGRFIGHRESPVRVGGAPQPLQLAEDAVEAVLGVVEDAPVVVDEVAAALVPQLAVDGRLEERRDPGEVAECPADHLVHARRGGRRWRGVEEAAAAPRRARYALQVEAELVERVHVVAEPVIRLHISTRSAYIHSVDSRLRPGLALTHSITTFVAPCLVDSELSVGWVGSGWVHYTPVCVEGRSNWACARWGLRAGLLGCCMLRTF